MKKLLTYCFTILFVAQLSAQNGRNPNEIKNKRLFNRTVKTHQMRINSLMNKKAISEKLDSTVSEYYDNGKWYTDGYDTYQVDANGRFISTTYYSWDDDDMRFNQYKDEFTYDGNGRLLLTNSSYYNFTDDVWEVSSKEENVYNSDGKLSNSTYSNWDPNANKWNESGKDEYEYDGNKNLIKSTYYYWSNNAWVPSSKDEYEFNGNNKKTKSNSFSWNQGSSDWENSYKSEISYNSDGNVSTSVSQDWDDNTNQWINDYRETYSYDANKNLKEGLFGNWDEMNNVWADEEKAEINYDLNVAFADVIFPSDMFGDESIRMNNKILGLNYFTLDGGNWVTDSKETYYYSSFTTSGINKANFADTRIYPNPAKDVVTFDLSNMASANEILVFDMNGKQVLNHSIDNGNQINVGDLSKGFYLYKIIGNDNISSGKLIIE